MRVRDPRLDDAPALGALHVRAWQRAYRGGLMPDDYLDGLSAEDRVALWRDALATDPGPRAARFVAEDDDGAVVGFVVVGPVGGDADADEGEVYALNVDPDVWGRGAGRALLESGVAHLRAAGFGRAVLWVHPGNQRARAFYRAAGWLADGAMRHEEVLGVSVPEYRYARALGAATADR
jgi:ribosomal protein S18 acetylase RimI-like enzyme